MDVLSVKKISRIERLQAMEVLWNSILYEDGQIESPEWHNQILGERKSIISSGKAIEDMGRYSSVTVPFKI